MQTVSNIHYHGRDFRVLHSTCRRANEKHNKVEKFHLIEIFEGGRLGRVRVEGFDGEAPRVVKLVQGCGWLNVCEVLTTWDELTPDDFLVWC